jgi:hypothetical protein
MQNSFRRLELRKKAQESSHLQGVEEKKGVLVIVHRPNHREDIY